MSAYKAVTRKFCGHFKGQHLVKAVRFERLMHPMVEYRIGPMKVPMIPEHGDSSQASTRLDHPPDFRKSPVDIFNIFEHLDGSDGIKLSVCE